MPRSSFGVIPTTIGRHRGFSKRSITPSSAPGLETGILDEFGQFDMRKGRYDLFWAYYCNNAYDNDGPGKEYKSKARGYDMGEFTRGTYNPLARLAEFWGNHVWPGKLDPELVNGRVSDSAIPIITDKPALRQAIGRVWRDSGWTSNKQIAPRLGSIKGDIAFKIDDDVEAGKVRILPIDPSTVRWLQFDRQGNVDGYMIQERRLAPRLGIQFADFASPNAWSQTAVYSELVTREGDAVRYRTFLDAMPWSWEGAPADYTIPYTFVPFVWHQHSRVMPGYFYGFSEYQCALAKVREVDELGSRLHDQVRVAAAPKWWVTGVQEPTTKTVADAKKDELPFFYGGMGSTINPMVFNLDIQFTSMEIQNQLTALEEDYPELSYASARISADASGLARREVRKSAEAKVHVRRAPYDDVHKRCLQMAISIAAYRGYDGYNDQGWTLDSYDNGDLDFEIGSRSVFLMDPLDQIEEGTKRAVEVQSWVTAGVPLEKALEWSGVAADQITATSALVLEKQKQALELLAIQAQIKAGAKALAAPEPKGNGGQNTVSRSQVAQAG